MAKKKGRCEGDLFASVGGDWLSLRGNLVRDARELVTAA